MRRACDGFGARFGRPPAWAAAAPGRVNLIGEHTDYNDGFVMPIAIDRVCVAAAAPAAEPGLSRIVAMDVDEQATVDLRRALRPDGVARGSWSAYVQGVIAGMAPEGTANLDMLVASSVPLGGGLSSSASLEVAVATLMERVTGRTLEPAAKALVCQRAEHEYAGVPCGIMDPFASVMGREGHSLLLDCRSRRVEYLPLPTPDEVLVVVANTNVRHALASGEYAARHATCRSAAAKLGVASLRDASGWGVEANRGRMTDDELRCARHVVLENGRTLSAGQSLRRGAIDEFGRLMSESHRSLRDDYRVSCPELDTLVELAWAQAGVLGARMTGGGFGGCIVALVEPGAVERVSGALRDEYRARHGRECTVFVTRASAGARVVSC